MIDTNSRVDFVWISDDIELKRIEGVIGKSAATNSVVYTDHYIISQLSTADNNRLHTCKVIIYTNQLLMAIGNFRLNVTGKLNVYNLCAIN